MAQNLPDRITKTGGAAALSATTGIKFQPVMVFYTDFQLVLLAPSQIFLFAAIGGMSKPGAG